MTDRLKYIEVAVALPVHNTFTYSVPESLSSLISAGKRVSVPFGRRRATGYILGLSENRDQKEIKDILDVIDREPLFPLSMIPFFRWIADYYIHPVGDVIKCALPSGLNVYEYTAVAITEKGKDALIKGSATPLENEILSHLESGSCSLKSLCRKLNREVSNSLFCAIESRGLIASKQELKSGRTGPKMEQYVSLRGSKASAVRLSESERRIIDAIKEEGEICIKKLKGSIPTASRSIRSLKNAGYISIFSKMVYRDPFGEPVKPDTSHILTREQKDVISTVASFLDKGFKTFLLTGVSGSGKTEVYMQLATGAIRRNIPVLVLVPEIALISQMERRFRARFGECIAVLHSGLSAGERYDQWMRIMRKEATITIGARSAIFAPFENTGIIIVDEEHDTSYKQEGGLHYNARDLAVVRAKLHGGIALLGSATPSIQSYHNVTTKRFIGIDLRKRVEERPLPETTVIDLRKKRDVRGTERFITRELYEAIRETLDHGKQVLLFLNRRGFASLPICAACGEAIKCKNCDISLTFHKDANAYRCHYCGFTMASASGCKNCGSSKVKLLGLGTEKVEAAVKTLFPRAMVSRMDRDTTVRKGSILKILKGLRDNTIDILVGTQMIAKGHDFPNITLVGIICADLSLSFPDFRAGERTFQLLAQVSGRAGRGTAKGMVILQTYNPDHFSILSAKNQDFKAFYDKEIGFRKDLNYPPFSRIIQLKISGRDRKKTERYAQKVGDRCNALQRESGSFLKPVEILGPIEAPLSRIAKLYRWQILLKSTDAKPLHRFIYRLLFKNGLKFNTKNVKLVVDVDPFFMM